MIYIYIEFAHELIGTHNKQSACDTLHDLPKPYDRLYGIQQLSDEEIQSSGYVVHALETALWSFLTTDSYIDCVLTAINLGGDTDTRAAIAGSLAGMYYGIESIPKNWRDALCHKELIDRITSDYITYLKRTNAI